jgi:flagellum-specific ATP synthase
LYPRIEAFLQQGYREQAEFEPSLAQLEQLFV